jgi:hypothetical protein
VDALRLLRATIRRNLCDTMTQTLVKKLTNNLKAIAALPKRQHPEKWFAQLTRLPEEKASDYRKRALAVIGKRVGYAASTMRIVEEGGRTGKDNAKLLDLVQKYGAVEFDPETGALLPDSLNKGMDPYEFIKQARPRAVVRPRPRA